MGYTFATHRIATASYFRWHRDEQEMRKLEIENKEQFLKMTNMLSRGRGHLTNPQLECRPQGQLR